jgi:RimJ/RimL family protein N-acetyltransferase
MIETARLILRHWKASDLSPFAAMNADPRVCEFFQSTLTEEQSNAMVGRIAQHFSGNGFGLWAAEVKGGAPFIGLIGLSIPRFEAQFTPCVEVGWRLAYPHWGKGYATEGARTAVAHAFDVLKLREVVSATANVRSRAVMEKIGMTHDPADDFDHPQIAEGHWQRRHVLYRLAPSR